MPAMQTAAGGAEAVAPRVPMPAPEQRTGTPANGAATPTARPPRPLPPRPEPPQTTGRPTAPTGPTAPTKPSTMLPPGRPMPPPLPGARQQPAEAANLAVNKGGTLPPMPLRPGEAAPVKLAATLAAAPEQPKAGNGAAPAKQRPRPGPPPLPRGAIPERRSNNIPPGLEPRPAPPVPPQQLRAAANGPSGSKPTGVLGPDFSKLPPNIAASLAKLAGRPTVPLLGGDGPVEPATADTAGTGDKPPRGS